MCVYKDKKRFVEAAGVKRKKDKTKNNNEAHVWEHPSSTRTTYWESAGMNGPLKATGPTGIQLV